MARPEPRALAPIPGPLALAAGLAAVAGCLDAVSLARLTGTFVAFQSGNTVLGGLELGRGEWAHAWPPLVAVLAYVVGSAGTPFVIGDLDPRRARRRLLSLATALLALDAAIVLIGFGTGAETPSGFWRYAGIVTATFAMAMQTPVVRTVSGVPVSTTFSSSMLVHFGQALGAMLRRSNRSGEVPVVRVLALVNASFLGGAILGGVLIVAWDNLAILAPLTALPVIAIWIDRAEPSA